MYFKVYGVREFKYASCMTTKIRQSTYMQTKRSVGILYQANVPSTNSRQVHSQEGLVKNTEKYCRSLCYL